jgi:histidinol-phosphate/aromatic aminotransferase/cobyric acid decarboxylase-like protein
LAERLLVDHAVLIKDCSNKAGMVNRQFVRVAVKDAADNDFFFAAFDEVMRDLINGGQSHPGRPIGGPK